MLAAFLCCIFIALWLCLCWIMPCLCVSEVPYFRDLVFDLLGIEVSAYMLATQAAQNLGSGQLAVQYAHEALSFHKNPVKTHYAHVKLGEMLWGRDEE